MEDLKTSPYVTIDNSNNIGYEFDEIVRFVIRSYFSAMYVAASWIAGDAIQHKKPHLAKGSVVLHQKEIDRITYRLLANSIDISKSIEEKLKGYISNLLCTTNEIRPRLKDFPDVLPNESDVSKWMEIYGLNNTIRKTIDYYFDRFNKNLPIDPSDEVSKFTKPKTGCHIDSWYISQALPLIFFDTLCSFLSDNAEIWLSVEMKSMVSDLIAIMFAELHYTKEDMQFVENEISMAHNNRYKIEVACRYPQVSCDAIHLIEDYYKNVFAESEGENYFFYEGDIDDERYSLLNEKYHRQIGINESLQSLLSKGMTKDRNNKSGVNPPVQLTDILNTTEAHELWDKGGFTEAPLSSEQVRTYCQPIVQHEINNDVSENHKQPRNQFREYIKDSERTDEIIAKLHRLIGSKKNAAAIRIIIESMWIEWIEKPSAPSVKEEFHGITCSETYINRKLKEGEVKPKKGLIVDEKLLDKIRKKFEQA